MPLFDLTCEWCGHEQYDVMERCETPTDSRVCPHCHLGPVVRAWLTKPSSVVGDEIDIWIKNGLCNEDGTPRRYTSKAEIAREAKRRGLVNVVEHHGRAGGDTSRHTVRWVSAPVESEEDRLRHWHEHENTLASVTVTPRAVTIETPDDPVRDAFVRAGGSEA